LGKENFYKRNNDSLLHYGNYGSISQEGIELKLKLRWKSNVQSKIEGVFSGIGLILRRTIVYLGKDVTFKSIIGSGVVEGAQLSVPLLFV
jgi:hypothetical protein